MIATHWSRGFKWFLLLTGLFGLIAVLVVSNRTAAFDERIIHAVQSAESPGLTSLAKKLSLVGSSKTVIAISLAMMAILFVFLKHRLELLLFLWVGVTSNILNTLLKNGFHRGRPDIHRLIEETGFSFPSGDSMAAFSVYGVLTFLLWRHLRSGAGRIVLVLVCFAITAAIGWSRIYLGVHYPSDVIGGYAASSAWLALSIALFESLRALLNRHDKPGLPGGSGASFWKKKAPFFQYKTKR